MITKKQVKKKPYTDADYRRDGAYIMHLLRDFCGLDLWMKPRRRPSTRRSNATRPRVETWAEKKRRFDAADLRRVALHESAHAIVAFKLGARDVHAEIGCNDFYGGVTKYRHNDPTDKVGIAGAGLLADARRQGFLGGIPAKIRAENRIDDLRVRRAAGGDAQIELRGLRRAFNIVTKNWDQITRVADWLIAHGMISHAEIERIIKGR